MKKLFIFLSVIASVFIWYSFASPTILNHSFSVDWNEIKLFWTDNSNWWSVDVNVRNPNTNSRLSIGTAKISDQTFNYRKQRYWDQKIWLIPSDGWDEIQFTIPWNNVAVTRTVIPVVPKAGPSGSLIWIILAALIVFTWYIYLKRKADI